MSLTPTQQQLHDPLLADFLEEAAGLLDAFHDHLLALETCSDDLPARLDDMFRAMHTLKGLAGMFELTTAHRLAHEVENILQAMRERRVVMARQAIDVLFAADDRLLQLLEALADGQPERCCDELINQLREVLVAAPAQPEQTSHAPVSAAREVRSGQRWGRTVRVLADQLDRFAELAGRMNVARASLAEACGQLESSPAADALRNTLTQLEQLAADLQRTVADACLTTLEPVLRRLRRVAREVAQQSGKCVRLRIDASEVRLDKRLVDALTQILVPLVQNAVDHGIELPDERTRLGKAAAGTVTISAQVRPTALLLQVRDDGRGLNADAIRARALELQLIDASALRCMAHGEVLQLITAPGLSTARQVTATSGRGVGMDIVRERIEALGGRLEIETQMGQGTTFRIELPM